MNHILERVYQLLIWLLMKSNLENWLIVGWDSTESIVTWFYTKSEGVPSRKAGLPSMPEELIVILSSILLFFGLFCLSWLGEASWPIRSLDLFFFPDFGIMYTVQTKGQRNFSYRQLIVKFPHKMKSNYKHSPTQNRKVISNQQTQKSIILTEFEETSKENNTKGI